MKKIAIGFIVLVLVGFIGLGIVVSQVGWSQLVDRYDAEGMLKLPFDPQYESIIIGKRLSEDRSNYIPYYVIETNARVYFALGGTVIDVGDVRIVVPLSTREFFSSSSKNINEVVVYSNSNNRQRSGGGGGDSTLGFYSYHVNGGSDSEVRLLSEGATLHSIKFRIDDWTLKLPGGEFKIGDGKTVVYLDENLEVSSVVNLDREKADVDMSVIENFNGAREDMQNSGNSKVKVRPKQKR